MRTQCAHYPRIEVNILKEKRTFIVMVGAPGSGKSTKARELALQTGALIVCPDTLREKYSAHDSSIFAIAREIITFTLKNGHRDVILDCTNTIRKYRGEMIAAGKPYAKKIVCIHMDTPLEECLRRHHDRLLILEKPTLTDERIREMHLRLQENIPSKEEFDEIIRILP